METEKCKMLWDLTIQCGHVIEARRLDTVVVEKENNKAIIVNIVKRLRSIRTLREKLEDYGGLGIWK